MPEAVSRYQVGDVATGATVLQGEYLYNIAVKLDDPEAAAALLQQLKKLGTPAYSGPLLRRLDPIVFVNRAEEISRIVEFFEASSQNVLYVLGLPAIGKSTLVRGALELRRAETPAVWITCEGLDAEQLLAEISAGLGLDAQAALMDPHARLATKVSAVLGAVKKPSVLVLDGFEVLLDAEDNYNSPRMAEVLDALVAFEHKAKVLVTTRRLPRDVGEGSAGSKILRLGGLSEPMAEALLQARARPGGEQAQAQALVPKAVLERLDGHPKFIELLASVMSELPVEQVVAGLLQASDIGAFVMQQIFGRLEAAELEVLRGVLVFRGTFTFDGLMAVGRAAGDEKQTILPAVRKLVRGAVLETVSGPQIGYYLHPILRDAVPRDAEQEAAAHAAASAFFFQTPFDPADITTWDDGLYHLRRSAEVGQSEAGLEAYLRFMSEKANILDFAGWGRRLVAEYNTIISLLDALVDDKEFKTVYRFALGALLWSMNEDEQAMEVLRAIEEDFSDPENKLLVKVKIGQLLVKQGKTDEAHRLVEEIKQTAEASTDAHYKYRYHELRFAIARQLEDPGEILQSATECFRLAEQEVEAGPERLEWRDRLAEAHFKMAIAYLRSDDTGPERVEKMVHHFAEQLRIKLDIGKLSGVAAGLYNVWMILSTVDSVTAGAFLLTSHQINHEIGVLESQEQKQIAEPLISKFFEGGNNIELGRDAIRKLSNRLLPYYERGVIRLAPANGSAAAPGTSGSPGPAGKLQGLPLH